MRLKGGVSSYSVTEIVATTEVVTSLSAVEKKIILSNKLQAIGVMLRSVRFVLMAGLLFKQFSVLTAYFLVNSLGLEARGNSAGGTAAHGACPTLTAARHQVRPRPAARLAVRASG
jgi:hypothetical protein